MTTTISNSPKVDLTDLVQYKLDLIDTVTSTNLGYLGIASGTILASGVLLSILMYFKFYAPLTQKLSQQEEVVLDLTRKIEEERKSIRGKLKGLLEKQKITFSELKADITLYQQKSIEKTTEMNLSIGKLEASLDEKSIELDKLIKKSNKKLDFIQAQIQWNDHYFWELKNIPDNVISSLKSCIVQSKIAESYWLIELSLPKLIRHIPRATKDDKTVNDDLASIMNHLEGIEKLIPQIDQEELEKVRSLIRET
ncbi:MAG: hypothetical protein WAW13_01195 [Minisyncoccia bacterium]